MLVVSFYTPDYTEHAERLKKSCRAFDIPYHIEAVDDLGRWAENCAEKGPFVLKMLRSTGRPVLWVDADGEVRRPLDDLALWLDGADFAAHAETMGKDNKKPWHFRSGTVFFRPTQSGILLCEEWAKRCLADPRKWDQYHLQEAWHAVDRSISTAWLPVEYCRIFDRNEGDSPTIVHYQASRKTRNKKPCPA